MTETTSNQPAGYEECCGNCNDCQIEHRCPYETPLSPEEYDECRARDKRIMKDREPKPIDMTRYIHNRPDREAYVRERDRQLDHARYWRNPEKRRKQALESYRKHRGKVLRRAHKYYTENCEEIKTKNSQRYHKNKEKINQQRREKRLEMKEKWKKVNIQAFTMSDGTIRHLAVIEQKSINFTATEIGYRISQVIDMTSTPISMGKSGVTFPYRYLYEEIDLNTDKVMESRYISLDTVKKKHQWYLVDDE